MTIPQERTRAVLETERFLMELVQPELTPHVPMNIRERAKRLLRHYPHKHDLNAAAKFLPATWGNADER